MCEYITQSITLVVYWDEVNQFTEKLGPFDGSSGRYKDPNLRKMVIFTVLQREKIEILKFS